MMNKIFTQFLTICLALLLFSITSQAQNANLLIKATSATNPMESVANGTAVDASGNTYIAGYIKGSVTFGTTTLVSAGGEDIFLAKYNSSGVFQWAKRAGGTGNDQAKGIAISGSDVYITGWFGGTANFNTPSATGSNEITSAGGTDFFVAKYNSAGDFQWAKRAGGTGSDYATGVAVSGNDVYITGWFVSTANFNTPSSTSSNTIISAGNDDIALAKYNSSGVFQWAKRAGGAFNDRANGVAVSESDVYITGWFGGTANFNTPSATGSNTIESGGGNGDILLAKYNSSGVFQWAKRAGGAGFDSGHGLAVSGSDVYITGIFSQSSGLPDDNPVTANFNTPSATGSNEITTAGNGDIFLAKYNSSGVFQWARRAGGASSYEDIGHGVAVSGSDVYITGGFRSTANFNTPSATGSNEITAEGDYSDIFIAKYSSTGNFVWAKRAGGDVHDIAYGIALSGSDVYITGIFSQTANFNTPSAPGCNELSTADFFVARDVFLARYGAASPSPFIGTQGTLSAFTICAGTASTQRTFTVSGCYLAADIIITAPEGFEVSTTGGSNFGSSVSLAPTGGSVAGTTIYVRLKATATGTPSGNITLTSTGALEKTVAASGTVNVLPTLTLGSISSVLTIARSFSIPYTATAGTPNLYSISTGTPTAMPSFVAVSNTALPASPISVTIPESVANTYNFNLTVRNTGTGCVSTAMPVALEVNVPTVPSISTTGSLTAFTTCAGTASAEQSFTVRGGALTTNITVAAPTGFEVSTTGGSGFGPSVSLVPTGGSVANTIVYVRMAATATGTPGGSVSCTSTGATDQTIAASGTVNSLPAPSITLGTMSYIESIDTRFSIPYTATTGSPSLYSISTGTPTAMPGFTPISNGSLQPSAISVTIPASVPGTYHFNLTVGNYTTGCVSTVMPVTLTVVAPVAQNANQLIKATSATSSDHSSGYGTAVDASGNTYITGYFAGSVTFGTTTLVSAGSTDIFLAKYNSAGVFQWARRAGGLSSEEGRGIAVSGNDVYITGYFNGTANFNTPSATGSNEITGTGSSGAFLAKYNSAGDFQWAKRAGGGTIFSLAHAYGVAASGNDVYITGYFRGTINFNTPSATGSNEITSAGGSDIFLAKYNSAGDFQWAKRAGSAEEEPNSFEQGYGVAVSGSDVYITGGFKGVANFNTPSATGSNEITPAGGIDIFLAKYNSEGVFQWVKRAGGTGGDSGYGVAVSGSDVYISGGFFGTINFNSPSATGSNTITSVGGGDAFLAKYNSAGVFQWARGAGGSNADQALGVAVSGNDVYITGYFYGGAIFLGSRGVSSVNSNYDVFLAKYDNTGTFQWARRGGGTNADFGRGIAASGGDIYVTGDFKGTANFNTPYATGSNEITTISIEREAFLARYSSPAMTTTGTLAAFAACPGTASSAQSFMVSGSGLVANITVTAPAGFEVSTTGGNGFGASVSLTPTGGSVAGTSIYVRMKADATGTPSGNITLSSTGVSDNTVAVSGAVNALPTITAGSISDVSIIATSFNIPYSATTGSPNEYSLSTGTPNVMPNFSAVSNIALTANAISVTIPASAAGTYHFNLTVRNSGTACVSAAVPVTLTVSEYVPPTISTAGTLTAFVACAGAASTQQSFTVNGSSLTAAITITAPAGFEVSTTGGGNFGASLSLPQTNGSVAGTAIYVRMKANATGMPSGNITLSSAGATDKNVATSGTVTTPPVAAISYTGSPFCQTLTGVAVMQTGATGGTYSATLNNTTHSGTAQNTQPAGLSINPTTGQINPSASAIGVYTVKYTIAASGGCPQADFSTTIGVRDCSIQLIYVNAANSNPTQNGTSWATAFAKLQEGLRAAAAITNVPVEVWVANGTYKPGTTRESYFNIPSGVKVYGGFVGTESSLTQRPAAGGSILSGEISTSAHFDNTRHVAVFQNTNAGTLLDGFTITRGYADFFPTTANVNDLMSAGGGVLALDQAQGTIANCTISGNRAMAGGGIFQQGNSRVNVQQSVIWGNEATFGGGFYHLSKSSPTYTNCLIVQNKAMGGAGYNNNSTPTFMNCTIASNQGNDGTTGGIANTNQSSSTFTNSIVWGNSNRQIDAGSVVTYSVVQGGYTGMGNLSSTPKFVGSVPSGLALLSALGDYRLLVCSPAINAATTTGAPAVDIAGSARPQGAGVDMGVHEGPGVIVPPTQSVTANITTGTVLIIGGTITATNQVANANVEYRAGSSVTLLPGFQATGNTFQATIGTSGCN